MRALIYFRRTDDDIDCRRQSNIRYTGEEEQGMKKSVAAFLLSAVCLLNVFAVSACGGKEEDTRPSSFRP